MDALHPYVLSGPSVLFEAAIQPFKFDLKTGQHIQRLHEPALFPDLFEFKGNLAQGWSAKCGRSPP